MSKFKSVAPLLNTALASNAAAKGLKNALTPDIPEASSLPPVPTAADPEIEAARQRQREAERLRKGRRASMITGGQGVTEPLGSVGRPEARAANLLGG